MSVTLTTDAAPLIAKPVISVVIPVRNDSARLRMCLEAIKDSWYPNYEIIVVDDASNDDTPDLLHNLGVRVVRLEQQSGPAAARNRGAVVARGEYLVFVDADVCVTPYTLGQFARAFEEEPDAAAVFGSYDDRSYSRNVLSQYKNLLHHHVHQEAHRVAGTFWAGCGAVRRSDFQQIRGFNVGYSRPCIEDIELGVRLRKAGRRIILDKDIQVMHLKRWTFGSILKTDIYDRAIPWSQLILQERRLPNDLNLKSSQRVCAALAWGLLLTFMIACCFEWRLIPFPLVITAGICLIDIWSLSRRVPTIIRVLTVLSMAGLAVAITVRFHYWAAIPFGLLAGLVLLNWRLLMFFSRRRHPLFAVLSVPMLILYYLYGSGVFAASLLLTRLRRSTVPPARCQMETEPARDESLRATYLGLCQDEGPSATIFDTSSAGLSAEASDQAIKELS